MLYFITGASGSGKTACIPGLRRALSKADIYDFDDIGVPKEADTIWRQQATEQWLQRYVQEGDEAGCFCICGCVVLGEILACPTAAKVGKINMFFLDVADLERIRRLQKREGGVVTQDMLNWSSWLRVHHVDASWQQNVIRDNAWSQLDFSCWENLQSWQSLANVTSLDTTEMRIDQVVSAIVSQMTLLPVQKLSHKIDIIPASMSDYAVIQNMAQFYVYDASRECGFGISQDGLFEPSDYKSYFEESGKRALVVRVNNELAGFVLLNQKGISAKTDWKIDQFFILAKFQGKGIGKSVAAQLWQERPGTWEVSVLPENKSALSYWQRVVSEYTGGDFSQASQAIDDDPHQSPRILLRFASGESS